MDNTKNKNLLIWLIVVLVVVAGLIYWSINSSTPAPVVETPPTPTPTTAPIVSTEDTTAGSVNTGTTASLTYQAALLKYKDARLQLDLTCQASPDKMNVKNGALVMIDNRAPVARTVKVGSTFSIKAYGFKIVKLGSATLPATWLVDCGTSQNVATFLIQK